MPFIFITTPNKSATQCRIPETLGPLTTNAASADAHDPAHQAIPKKSVADNAEGETAKNVLNHHESVDGTTPATLETDQTPKIAAKV